MLPRSLSECQSLALNVMTRVSQYFRNFRLCHYVTKSLNCSQYFSLCLFLFPCLCFYLCLCLFLYLYLCLCLLETPGILIHLMYCEKGNIGLDSLALIHAFCTQLLESWIFTSDRKQFFWCSCPVLCSCDRENWRFLTISALTTLPLGLHCKKGILLTVGP